MDTSGFKGWWPMKFFEGKKDGQMTGREGFRNVLNGQEFKLEKGWNEEPPYPTGDLACARHIGGGSDEFWENLRNAEPLGEIIHQGNGRTVFRY